MKINTAKVAKFQEGGVAPTPETGQGAPTEEQNTGQQDPLLQIAEIFAQGLQAQDCQALAQGAQAFLELISQAQGAAQGQAPAQQPPVFKKGGKMIGKLDTKTGKVTKTCCGGGKVK